MNIQRIPFFATPRDLCEVLHDVESREALRYVRTGLFEQRNQTTYSTYAAIPDLGLAKTGVQAQEATYLILPPDAALVIREVPQKSGDVRFAIDQLYNQATVALRPGGLYDDDAIIAGQLGTASDHPRSRALFSLLRKVMRQRFKKIKAYLVGDDAAQRLDSGTRLVTNVESPSEYDLSRH